MAATTTTLTPMLLSSNVKSGVRQALPQPPPKNISTPSPGLHLPEQEDSSPICVKWNTYTSIMSTVMPNLLLDEKFVDVTLACDGKYIKCHKVILGACSAYFEELLAVNPCQHPIVLLRDFKFWEIQAIIDFIYKGVVSIPQDKLPKLLQVASILQIKGLVGCDNEAEVDERKTTESDINKVTGESNINVPISKPGKTKVLPKQKELPKRKVVSDANTFTQCLAPSVDCPRSSTKEPPTKIQRKSALFCNETQELQNSPLLTSINLQNVSLPTSSVAEPELFEDISCSETCHETQELQNSPLLTSINMQNVSLPTSSVAVPELFEDISCSETVQIKSEPTDFDVDGFRGEIELQDTNNRSLVNTSTIGRFETLTLPDTSLCIKEESNGDIHILDSGGDPLDPN